MKAIKGNQLKVGDIIKRDNVQLSLPNLEVLRINGNLFTVDNDGDIDYVRYDACENLIIL